MFILHDGWKKSHVFLNRYISLDPVYKVRDGKKDLCMHIIILCMLETKPCLACKHTTNMAKLKVKILTIKLHVSWNISSVKDLNFNYMLRVNKFAFIQAKILCLMFSELKIFNHYYYKSVI